MRIPSPPPSSAPKAAPSGGGGKAAAPAPASGGGKSQACDAIRQYVSSVAPGTNWAFSPAPDLSVDKLGNFLRGVASWDTPFDPLDTRRLAFTLDVGERIEVDMMKIDGERMDVSGLLSGDPRFVVKRLHPQSTVSGMGPGAGAESASGLRMLYAQRDPHACEALTDAGLLDWLLDALAASAPLGELLGLRTATVDFSVPRFAQLIQTDRPSHDFFLVHNEEGVRAAPGEENLPVTEWHPPDHRVTLDTPFFVVMLTAEGYPLLVTYQSHPVTDDSPLSDLAPAG